MFPATKGSLTDAGGPVSSPISRGAPNLPAELKTQSGLMANVCHGCLCGQSGSGLQLQLAVQELINAACSQVRPRLCSHLPVNLIGAGAAKAEGVWALPNLGKGITTGA